MTDYDDLRDTIMRLAAEWEPRLDLPGIAVSHRFIDSSAEDDPDTVATTFTRWHYRHAVIRWYLPACRVLTLRDLEDAVVHEYAHVLLAAIGDRLTDGSDEHNEHATESVSRALLCTFRAAGKGKKK